MGIVRPVQTPGRRQDGRISLITCPIFEMASVPMTTDSFSLGQSLQSRPARVTVRVGRHVHPSKFGGSHLLDHRIDET